MTHMENTKTGIAGPVTLMFLAGMALVWWAYLALFPQDVLTFLLMLGYIPIVVVIAALLYRKLSRRV